ncbi:MAG: hypothetical protein LBR74_03705 [Eubacterium sp.]|jgi:hypothetical protein|nr:hypothetical protein [Eubacterium sp.]
MSKNKPLRLIELFSIIKEGFRQYVFYKGRELSQPELITSYDMYVINIAVCTREGKHYIYITIGDSFDYINDRTECLKGNRL